MRALLLVALICCAVAIQSAGAEPAATTKVAKNKLGQTVQVRDINDPASPYAGQYSAVDLWTWENYVAVLPPEVEAMYTGGHSQAEWDAFQAKQPKDWAVQHAEVDEQGWLIPFEVARNAKNYRAAPRTLRQEVTRDYPRNEVLGRMDKRFHFRAAGIFGPELRAQQEAAIYRSMADDIPRIPAWLGSRPPLTTVIVPNGEFIVHGPLNLHLEDEDKVGVTIQPNGSMALGEAWYRYSADGRLLGTYPDAGDGPHGFRWQAVYVDLSLVEQSFKDRGVEFATHYATGGYTVYVSKDGSKPGEILAAYDYAGNPVDPDTIVVDHYIGSYLPQGMLEHLFKALVATGTVDSSEQSAWEGTPQGPVAVDPTPRPRKLMAQRSHRVGVTKQGSSYAGTDYIPVKPLDDPASPYRDQYKPWDQWIFSQVNKRNPRETEWEKQNRGTQTLKIGQSFDKSQSYQYFKPSFDDPWRTFILKVDDNGYVIPFMHGRAESYQRRMQPAKWDSMYLKEEPPHHYQIQAGGVMPDEIKAALLGELRRETPQRFPPEVPAWLQAAPPYMFQRMPDGNYVTEGPLGSWSPDWQLLEERAGLDRKDRYLRHGWYRYSADGELLASVQSDSWTELYNPNYKALRAEGLAAGYTVWEMGGYLAWYTKASGTGIDDDRGGDIVRKWDYLGNEVPADTSWYRPDGALRQWRWEDVLRAQHGELPDWI